MYDFFIKVEDRRLEVERKLIGLQVKHDTLEKTHSVLRQQYRKLKVYESLFSMAVLISERFK